jgi:ubiquinone/menaquinone biosynthesis C-methylase UbiE
MTSSIDEVREQVRSRYAAAAQAVTHGEACQCGESDCCSDGLCCTGCAVDQRGAVFGAGLYDADEQDELPEQAVQASLGCGNPVAVADLRPGETVLDLGSGGGIDVLLSARRVGADGFAYGVDMTDQMLDLARANAAKAGVANVEFRKGTIEDLPLPDASIDVVISNCVINLSGDKPAVLREMIRVLKPGGRIGISDVVAEDHLSANDRAARGSFSGCIAGALSQQEYLDGLAAAGFTDAAVRFTHEAEPQMHAAIITATKPTATVVAGHADEAGPAADACCDGVEQASCCEPDAKAGCCTDTGTDAPSGAEVGSTSCGCR